MSYDDLLDRLDEATGGEEALPPGLDPGQDDVSGRIRS